MEGKPVTNIDDVQPITFGNGGRFEGEFRWLSRHNGAQKLGYNHVTLAPGKTAFPYHCHHANEEAFFITEGTGLLRYDGKEYPLRAGDVVACPPGKRSAHQITNDSDGDLKYLAISTKQGPEVVQYPDSNKVAMTCDPDPEDGPDAPPFRLVVKADAGVDYWEGEG
jgi:uncharacterized cupin superfamily protein